MSQWSSSLPPHLQGTPMTPSKPAGSFRGSKAHSRPARFNMDNLVGSPFFLTTISIAVIGWVIAFIASIAANAQDNNFSHFAWWALMYQLCVIGGICAVLLYDTTTEYQIAICAFLASALSFTASTANALIYSDTGAQEAAAAGHILLSIANILWILYHGTTPDAAPRMWADSHSLHKSSAHDRRQMADDKNLYPSGRYGTPYPISVVDADARNTLITSESPNLQHTMAEYNQQKSNRDTLGTIANAPAANTDYVYRAKAIYSYEANPEDPNEIGFTKGDILEVADCTGKWFQARNPKGEVGIAPSNYLTLMPMDA